MNNDTATQLRFAEAPADDLDQLMGDMPSTGLHLMFLSGTDGSKHAQAGSVIISEPSLIGVGEASVS